MTVEAHGESGIRRAGRPGEVRSARSNTQGERVGASATALSAAPICRGVRWLTLGSSTPRPGDRHCQDVH